MKNTANITVIGAGNMGASLIGGLIKKGYASDRIWVTDTDSSKLELLKKQFQVHIHTDNNAAIQQADVIILAVKPQILTQVLSDIAEKIQARKPLIISIAAGVRIDTIQTCLGGSIPIVRTMPNTPALIGCGASALFANAFVNEEQYNFSESILRAVGITIWVKEESLMDAVTAVSGSGPAYFFLVIEAMQHAAEKLGLPADAARLLTLQTAFGAASMALESDYDVIKLRHNVTSPGGTTEQAVRVLEEENIRHIFLKALTAARDRSAELAALSEKKKEH